MQLQITGSVKFKQNVGNEKSVHLFHKFNRKLFTKTCWWLSEQNYVNQKVNQLFIALLQASKVETLNLHQNDHPRMLIEISNVNMSALKIIRLSQNRIESAQPLCTMNLENLVQLCLSQNELVNCKFLHKIYAPKLEWLSLSQNNLNQIDWISQLSSKKINVLVIKWHTSDKNQIDNYYWACKLNRKEKIKLAYFRINNIVSVRHKEQMHKICKDNFIDQFF